MGSLSGDCDSSEMIRSSDQDEDLPSSSAIIATATGSRLTTVDGDGIYRRLPNDNNNDNTRIQHYHVEEGNRKKILRIIIVIFGICMILYVFIDAFTERRIEKSYEKFVTWVSLHPFLGIIAVILVYALATICFIPGSLLTIGTGYAFASAFSHTLFLAVTLSSIAVFLGASLGSLSCLLLGRYLFREPVLRLAENYPVIKALDRALEAKGFEIMLLLRLSPLIPYNALDYISGVTSISILHYCMAFVGFLPGAITMCYVGATASSLAEGKSKVSEDKTLNAIILIAGLFFAFAGGIMASYYSKIELDKIIAANSSNNQDDNNNQQGETEPVNMFTPNNEILTDNEPISPNRTGADLNFNTTSEVV